LHRSFFPFSNLPTTHALFPNLISSSFKGYSFFLPSRSRLSTFPLHVTPEGFPFASRVEQTSFWTFSGNNDLSLFLPHFSQLGVPQYPPRSVFSFSLGGWFSPTGLCFFLPIAPPSFFFSQSFPSASEYRQEYFECVSWTAADLPSSVAVFYATDFFPPVSFSPATSPGLRTSDRFKLPPFPSSLAESLPLTSAFFPPELFPFPVLVST